MILITEFMDSTAVARLSGRYPVQYQPELVQDIETLQKAIIPVRALIVRNRTKVDSMLLEFANKLECVGRLGVGLENIDLELCKKRGIIVHKATGTNDQSVAEYVISAILLLSRKAFFHSAKVIEGTWPRLQSIGSEIAGKTLGLIGFGSTGKLTAQKAQSLGMTVIAHDPYAKDQIVCQLGSEHLDLPELFSRSDVLSVHIPYNDSTHHIVSAELLSLCSPGTLIINTSRGGVADEDAIIHFIKKGTLGGAALDVFEVEPLDRERSKKFEGIENLILTPHIAGVTRESNVRVSNLIVDKILEHFEKCI